SGRDSSPNDKLSYQQRGSKQFLVRKQIASQREPSIVSHEPSHPALRISKSMSLAMANNEERPNPEPPATPKACINLPIDFLQSILEFKRLAVRMFNDPQLRKYGVIYEYQAHFNDT